MYDPDQPRGEDGRWISGNLGLSGPETYAVDWYKANGYKIVNEGLRREGLGKGDSGFSASTRQTIGHLDRVTERQTFERYSTVYRGIAGKRAGKLYSTPGSTVTEHGFLSTSDSLAGVDRALRDTEATGDTTYLRIRVPKGTKTGNVSSVGARPIVGARPSEGEYLFGRGHRLQIRSSSVENGRRVVDADLLPPQSRKVY